MNGDLAQRCPRWGRRPETLLIAVVALVTIGGTALAARNQADVRDLDAGAFALLAAAVAALPLRRRWPVPALGAVFVLTLGYFLANYPNGPLWLPLIIAFGTVLVRGYRLAAYTVLAAGYGAFLWLVPAVADEDYPSGWAIVGLAAWLLLLAAVSEVVRNRRAYLRASRQRTLEEQRSREEQVRRQASEQRLGIARELHDVLAHSISMINVQAGVALELMEQQPEQARSALSAIKQASKEALVEVQGVLDSLRGVDEDAPRAPTPTLADLESLIQRARAAGLSVRTETSGQRVVLPAAVDRAAFRIVQEALTNVVRHADATTATVHLDYSTNELRVRIDDDGRAPAPPSGMRGTERHLVERADGNGITGMRERATALGGQFTATPLSGGGFRVTARLPISANGAT